MKDKTKVIFYIILTIIGIIVIGLGLFLLKGEKKKETPKDNRSAEEVIQDNYNFSENDAVNLIKKIFHSDNYKFEAKANDDGLYEVIVTNTTSNSKFIYYVEPATKTYKLEEK